MTEHTPGPWAYSNAPKTGIATVAWVANYAVGPSYVVGPDHGSPEMARYDNHGSDEADARLIAAAPDLLAALKSAEYAVNVTRACLMDSVETHGTHGGWLHGEALRLDSELDLIRAAIAKAQP